MEIFTRRISIDDVNSITALSSQLGYNISKEATIQNIKAVLNDAHHNAFVAVHEDKVIAWIHLFSSLQIESLPFCEIRGLVVDERYRKQGIGKMLVEKAMSWAKEKNLPSLRLRCNAVREETHRFYETLGFKEIKQQKVFSLELVA
jgi:GNAT superfamily N-acetyltransferase